MKFLILAFALSLSTSAFARQYIQCSTLGDSNDVAVINLPTTEAGTLFLSSGMEGDERILVNIKFDAVAKDHHVFKVVDERGEGFVYVPSEAIEKSANDITVDLKFADYSFSYSCFSRIYND